MKKTSVLSLEYTMDELNAMLIRHIQVLEKIKITEINHKGNVVTLRGMETSDLAVLKNGIESEVLHRLLPGLAIPGQAPIKKGKFANRKNKGMTGFIREQFEGGEKIAASFLCELINTSGYEITESVLRAGYLKGNLKDELTEVSPAVFQLTSVYEKSHNNGEIVHN